MSVIAIIISSLIPAVKRLRGRRLSNLHDLPSLIFADYITGHYVYQRFAQLLTKNLSHFILKASKITTEPPVSSRPEAAVRRQGGTG